MKNEINDNKILSNTALLQYINERYLNTTCSNEGRSKTSFHVNFNFNEDIIQQNSPFKQKSENIKQYLPKSMD